MVFRELLFLQNSRESGVGELDDEHIVVHFYDWPCDDAVAFERVGGFASHFIKDIAAAHFLRLLELMLERDCQLILDELNHLKVVLRTVLLLLLERPLLELEVIELLGVFHQVANNLMLPHVLAVLV